MKRALAIIVLAQLFGTSLWFTGNSAAVDLARAWGLSESERSWLLTAVQAGFIVGTLGISISGLADAFAASRIFAAAAVVGALANAGFALLSQGLLDASVFRFVTGLALAGIYPLGMKLVVTWAPRQAGAALGWLVGALTVGTASPHLVRALGPAWSWQSAILVSSGLALLAAVMVLWLGDGPAAPQRLRQSWGSVGRVFRIPEFRASALGYFGHMWELYAFWNLVPNLLIYLYREHASPAVVGGLAFSVIGCGAAGCVLGGLLSQVRGSRFVAASALVVSGTICMAFPLLAALPFAWGLGVMLIWGIAVVADSPQFSALSAKACPPETVGAALAVQNGIGFLITTISIQLTAWLWPDLGVYIAWVLAPGPLLGLAALLTSNRQQADAGA